MRILDQIEGQRNWGRQRRSDERPGVLCRSYPFEVACHLCIESRGCDSLHRAARTRDAPIQTFTNGCLVRGRQATVEAVECPKEMESGVSAHHVATCEEPWRSRAAADSGRSPERLTEEHRYDARRGDNGGRWRRIGALTF